MVDIIAGRERKPGVIDGRKRARQVLAASDVTHLEPPPLIKKSAT